MRYLRAAVEARRAWGLWAIASLAGFTVLLLGTLRAEALVYVSYQVSSESVQVGSHEFHFSASKDRNGANTTLYAYVTMTDGNGTPGTADDVTQTHQYSFTLPADALTVTDNLGTVKFNSGPLKLPGGGGRNYGMIQFTGTHLEAVNNVPSDCYPLPVSRRNLQRDDQVQYLPGWRRKGQSPFDWRDGVSVHPQVAMPEP